VSKFKEICADNESLKTLLIANGVNTGIIMGSMFTMFPMIFAQMGLNPLEIGYV